MMCIMVTLSRLERQLYLISGEHSYLYEIGLQVECIRRAMLHDEAMYPEPFRFYPDRWLDSDGKLLDESKAPLHPFKAAFGFGRRYDLLFVFEYV